MLDRRRTRLHTSGMWALGRQLRVALLAALAAGALAPLTSAAANMVSAAPAIVVILDSSEGKGDSYLDSAWNYYRALGYSPSRVNSLLELHNLLVNHSDYGDKALGEIVLVAHGSTWTGAAIDLFPGGSRASVSNMRTATSSGAFPPLPAGSMGAQTRITLESCAVGRHAAWLKAFAELWVQPSQAPPSVQASNDFVAFGQASGAASELTLQRLILPANVAVMPELPELDRPTRQVADGADCAPIAAPCEQRLLPIRVTVDLDPSLAGKSFALRRRYAQQQARQQLLDLNLRADQLDWRWERGAESAPQRWSGVGTAIVTTPSLTKAQLAR